MSHGQDGVRFDNLSATPASFKLQGGRYAIAVAATWGGGSVTLNQLGPDNSTFINVLAGAFLANGNALADLPAGQYTLTIATATAVYATIARVPIG